MSPRRKPAFQDFQELSEPVPCAGESAEGRACPLSGECLSLIRERVIFRACPLLGEFSEPVPCIGGLSLIGVGGGRGGRACPLLETSCAGGREEVEPVPY